MALTGRSYHVTAGAVDDGPRAMHGSWQNTTNLECYSAQELLDLGWLPEDEQLPVLAAGETLDSFALTVAPDTVQKIWTKRAMTAGELADQANTARIADILNVVNTDATIQSIKGMTVSQIDTWLTNNVTSLAQARTVLAYLIKIVVSKVL